MYHILIFYLLSALCAGNYGTAFALRTYMGPEGGNGTINCYLSSSEGRKFFCKNNCDADDLLIKTDGTSAQSGRYSVKYDGESSGRRIVSVTITNLIKSDAGNYRSGLGESSISTYCEFGVRVSDGILAKNSGFIVTEMEGGKISYGCSDTVFGQRKFLCKNRCKSQEDVLVDTNDATAQRGRYSLKYDAGSTYGLYVTMDQVTTSDTGWYRCGYGNPKSPDSYRDKQIIVTADPKTSTPQTETLRWTTRETTSSPVSSPDTDQPTGATSRCVLSSALLGSIVSVLLLAVFVLLLYIWKSKRSSGFTGRENTVNTNVELCGTWEDSVYENIKQPCRTQNPYSAHSVA